MHLRLSNGLALGFIASITAIFLLLGIGVTVYLHDRYDQHMREQLAHQAELAALVVGQAIDDPAIDPAAIAQQIRSSSGTDVTILAPDGTTLGASGNPATIGDNPPRPEVATAIAGSTSVIKDTSGSDDTATWSAAAPVRDGDRVVAVVRLSTPYDQFSGGFSDERTALALTILAAALATLFVVTAFASVATRPLEKIVSMTRRVSRGDLNARALDESQSEFAEVAIAFNEMADELQATFNAIDLERARLESIVEHLADGIVIVDAEGKVVLMNFAAERLLGIERSRAMGRTYAEVLRDYELAAVVREGRAAHAAGTAPIAHIVEMGRPRRSVQAFSYPIPAEGTPLVLVVLRDVTEFRRTEAVRRDFVANVSHDLRTPIASLKALVETLLDGALDDPAAARDFLSRMEVEVDDLVRLVEELLQLSRAEAGQIELRIHPSAIGQIIRRVAERLEAQAFLKGIEIGTDIPADLPPAHFDADRVEQVLVNLVHNAIKFTPAHGIISIQAIASDQNIVVAVHDSGPGLEPADLERVFERFYKTDRSRAEPGSGLGLAIAKHLIQLHGGQIWAESEYGKGAIFKFSLPIAPTDTQHDVPQAQPDPDPTSA